MNCHRYRETEVDPLTKIGDLRLLSTDDSSYQHFINEVIKERVLNG